METLVLTIKDPDKKDFLLELLSNLTYVKVESAEVTALTKEEKDKLFFDGAGMWKDRDIDADQLRKDAWTR